MRASKLARIARVNSSRMKDRARQSKRTSVIEREWASKYSVRCRVVSRYPLRAMLESTNDSSDLNGFPVHRRATGIANAQPSSRAPRPQFDVAKPAAENLSDR
jgi:hypothetical protein